MFDISATHRGLLSSPTDSSELQTDSSWSSPGLSRSRSRKQEAPVGLQGKLVQVTANREAIHPLRKWGHKMHKKPARPSAKGARDRHTKPFAIIVPSFSMFCVCLQLPRSQQYLSGRMSGLA